MNYSHIDLILGIAEAGSISEAAENMYVSQPFLSSTLKKIESEIGTELFVRSKSGVKLTSFGREYVQFARQISEQIETLDNLYRNRQAPQFRLDVVSGGFRFLAPILHEIRQKYIGIPCTFNICEGERGTNMEAIRQGAYEVGIFSVYERGKKQFIREITKNGLEYIPLKTSTPGVYISKNSKNFPADITQIDQSTVKCLLDMPFIQLYYPISELSVFYRYPIINMLFKCAKNSMTVSNIGLRFDMINECDGFSLGNFCASLYEKYEFYDSLRFIPFASELEIRAEIGWIQRKNQQCSLLASELKQILLE